MVQLIGEAHRTLVEAAGSATPPAGAAPSNAAKPALRPLAAGQTPPSAPRPPSPDTWSARSAPVTGAPVPPQAAPATSPTPKPAPVAAAPEPAAKPSAASAGSGGKVTAYYAMLFPLGSQQRRFAPIILVAAVVLILLLGKCAFSSSGSRSASGRPPVADPQTTGQLLLKSNRADATFEVTRGAAGGEAPSASVNGAAGQTLPGLRPGKYVVMAHSAGWPDTSQDVTVDVARVTEAAVNFKSGSLRLDSDPSGASVRWGEEVLGRTPLVIPQLPVGESRLSLEYPFWPTVTIKATVTENAEAAATVRLPHGKLSVESSPSGATVLIGGRSVGQTPLVIESIPAGPKKLTLQAKDFPPLELSVTVEDRGDVKVNPELGSAFPELDPAELLRNVWVPDNPDNIAPPNDGMTGPSAPRNDIIKNLNRKRLYEQWLRKRFRLTGVVKAYDPNSGQVEFAEQRSELSRYRVLAKLGSEAFKDKDLAARLAKGATVTLYGQLTAAEEPRWPFKVITFEISAAELLR